MKHLVTPLRLVLLGVLLAAVVVGFVLLPADATLPIHWNAAGEADGFAPRNVALLWPLAVTALIWALFVLIGRFARPEKVRGGTHLSGAVLTGLTALFALIAIVTVLIGLGRDVEMVRAIGFALSLLLLVMGNALPKSQPNSVAGLRIPTTMRDPANWQATHRFTGWLCIGGGLLLLAAAAFAPAASLIWILLVCVIAPMLAGTLYSLAYARRAHS